MATKGNAWAVVLNQTMLLGGDSYMLDGYGFGETPFGYGPFGVAVSPADAEPVTNYLENPRPTSTTGWGVVWGSTVTYDPAKEAVKVVSSTSASSGVSFHNIASEVVAGETWTYCVEVEAITNVDLSLSIQGATVPGGYSGAVAVLTPGGTTRLTVTITHVASGLPSFYLIRNGTDVVEWYAWEAMQTKTAEAVPYFDGATPDTYFYNYQWNGAANASPSMRTAAAAVYPSDIIKGCLTKPPDGLGVPGLRVEDQSYPQRDGAAQFSDWYEPRIITLEDVSIAGDGCADCTAREKAAALMRAWSRHCGQTEMVIWTDCEPGLSAEDRAITGPFGVVGRPRVAQLAWTGQGSDSATALLRFDSVDHRLYILDRAGTPGSGRQCAVTPYSALPDPPTAQVIYPLDEKNLGSGSWGDTFAYNSAGVLLSDLSLLASERGGIPKGYPPLYANGGTSSLTFMGDTNWFFRNTEIAPSRSVSFWYQYSGSASNRPFISPDQLASLPEGTYSGLYRDKVRAGGVDYPLSAPTQAIFAELGVPHHVVFTADATGTQVIVDGVLMETLPAATADAFPAGAMAAEQGMQLMVLGYYSNLRLYDVKMTEAQAQALYYSDTNTAAPGATTVVDVVGTECVPVTITFEGVANGAHPFSLSNPKITTEDGNFIGLSMSLTEGMTAVLDTELGTATMYFSGGAEPYDVTAQMIGDPFLNLRAGSNSVTAQTTDADDNGTISICWRPAVISA